MGDQWAQGSRECDAIDGIQAGNGENCKGCKCTDWWMCTKIRKRLRLELTSIHRKDVMTYEKSREKSFGNDDAFGLYGIFHAD